jgi:hypothetical protein
MDSLSETAGDIDVLDVPPNEGPEPEKRGFPVPSVSAALAAENGGSALRGCLQSPIPGACEHRIGRAKKN